MIKWMTSWKPAALLLLAWIAAVVVVELPLEERPFSPVLYSDEGELIAATVAGDEQWRFPRSQELPEFLKDAILHYEDEYFFWHPGINPASLWKSWRTNREAGKIVRGGSTLTMQVARMVRNRRNRGYFQKMLEMLAAFKLELLHSKDEILAHWCRLAPFGGNIEGIETAAWRFFGRPLHQLSRAEMATLAVLPNSPALIHPGKNRFALLEKRNALLAKMCDQGFIQDDHLPLLQAEPLPQKPYDLPQEALHLLVHLKQKYPSQYLFKSNVSVSIQKRTNLAITDALAQLEPKGIRSAAALVLDIEKNELKAYCGNTPDADGYMRYVDLVHAPRSYGSLLKPMLYAYAIDRGALLPNELISDIPTHIQGFEPDNFDEKFRGAVPFDEMLIQSLNVPAVRALHYLGYRTFYDFLQTMQPEHLDRGADHYGLSIILGGAESDLWSMGRMYKGLARSYLGYPRPFSHPLILQNEKAQKMKLQLGKFAVDHTVRAMTNLEKPREEQGWQQLRPVEQVAWKTGTSYGHRDAWAIGFNKKFLVAVWVGNEDGEGREGLTGINVAAPIFFKLMEQMSEKGHGLLRNGLYDNQVQTCAYTGRRAGPLCDSIEWLAVDKISHQWRSCGSHKVGAIKDRHFHPLSCLESELNADTFFVLPAVEESFYRSTHAHYFVLPPLAANCWQEDYSKVLHFLYPYSKAKIFLPVESNGERRALLARVATQGEREKLFWYLNNQFLGVTSKAHEMACLPVPGQHRLTVIRESGHRISTDFAVSWE